MKTTIPAAVATLCLGFYAASADASALLARIDIAAQTMTVSENGITRYQWKVSTARPGYVTPTGNYTAKWLSRDHH